MKTFFLLLIVLASSACAVFAEEAVFVVNPSVKETELSTESVRGILLGNKTSWESGNLKLVVQTEGTLHELVIRTYTQRSTDQFDKYWKKQVFTGKGMAPAVAKTDAEVIDYVAKHTGAIGYVASVSATAAVKVLLVK